MHIGKRVPWPAVLGLAGLAILALAPGTLRAQQDLATQQVRPNLYVITGRGGNTAFLVTDDGVLVVDTKLPNSGTGIVQEIRKVTQKPILYVINTHLHGDHVGSNDTFPLPATLIAQQNVRDRMARAQNADQRRAFFPRVTFSQRSTVFIGDQRVELYYMGRGHTDGDTVVTFPDLNLVHLGDLFVNRSYPLIDTNSGGSGVQFLPTLRKAAEIADLTTYIPGHGDVATRDQYLEYIGLHEAMNQVAADAVKKNQPAADAAKDPRLAKYADWRGADRLPRNLQILMDELKAAQAAP